MDDLTLLSLVGKLGICTRGAMQGGILVVVGHPEGAILPEVKRDSWIEYGPDSKYDREPFFITQDHAYRLRDEGWIEACSNQYASVHWRLTEKAWKFYQEFLEWREQSK